MSQEKLMSWKNESKNLRERTDDVEEQIRDLTRRIEEARNRLFAPQPSFIERLLEMAEQRSSLESSSKEQRRN